MLHQIDCRKQLEQMKTRSSLKNNPQFLYVVRSNTNIRTTVYSETTRIGGKGLKTLKDFLQTNSEGYNINEASNRPLNIHRTTVHPSVIEMLFKLPYCRKPNPEIHTSNIIFHEFSEHFLSRNRLYLCQRVPLQTVSQWKF